MALTHDFETFARVFSENLTKRSRTAKGISETSISPAKKPLLKSGEELKKQVRENTEKLIRFVWECGIFVWECGTILDIEHNLNYSRIRWFCENCDRLINSGLIDPLQYEKERELLRKNTHSLSLITGIGYKINAAYRVWNVSYCGTEIPLCELEYAMRNFYATLAREIPRHPQKRVLAFADHMMDGVIHPWADGCGRNATALVMWMSFLSGYTLPVFGSRGEHYASICDLDAHTEYFRRCLERE